MRCTGRPPSHRRRVLSAVTRVLMGAGFVVGAGALPAGSVFAADSIAVDAGYGGFAQAGRPFPITVHVSVDRLFEGELRISSQDGSIPPTTWPLELAGGTTRELTVVMQSNPWQPPAILAELVSGDGGDVVAKTTVRLKAPKKTELVGVFPGLVGRGLPETSSLTVDIGEAQLFEIDPAVLAFGAGAIAPLDIIAVASSDLRNLDDDSERMLLGWVSSGGRLLIDESAGTRVGALPESWQPDGSFPRAAGLGEVMLTDGAAGRGEWAEILEPAPTRSRLDDQAFGEFGGFWGGEPLSWSLGRDSGFNLPGSASMFVMLGVYVAVAGPVTWYVLRMLRRPGLAWVVIPALSIVFTGALWMVGSSVRSGVEIAHGTIIEVAPVGSTASTFALVSSRSGGDVVLSLPEGWVTRSSFNEGPAGVTDVAPNSGGGHDVTTELDAGAFAVLGGTGPMQSVDGGLEIDAISTRPGRVSGTITNHMAVDLGQVAVFADQSVVKVGDVAAGAVVEFELTGPPVDPSRGEPAEFTVWRDALPPEWTGEFGRPFEPGAINLSLWNEWMNDGSANTRQVGSVVLAAWTDELVSPIDPTVTNGRTLIVSRAPIEVDDGLVTDIAAARQIVRGPDDVGTDFRNFNIWGGGAVFAFRLPEEAASRDDLVLSLPSGQQRVELLVDGAFRQIDLASNNRGVFALPDGAIDERGRVYVTALLSFEQGLRWRDLSVRVAGDNDKVLPLEFVEQEAA